MSSSFGQWYEDQQRGGGESNNNSSSSWNISTESLPLFNSDSIPSLSSMRASMEAQMPKKIMGMGYQQRYKVFLILLLVSAIFFALAFFVGLPMIAVRPQKFAISFTCGSILFLASFGILKGPMEHLQSLITSDRIVFTTVYFASMAATLYFTFSVGGVSGYVTVLSASILQLVALLWYLISFLPGGTAGLSYVAAALKQILRPVLVACGKLQLMCIQYCCGRLLGRTTNSTSATPSSMSSSLSLASGGSPD